MCWGSDIGGEGEQPRTTGDREGQRDDSAVQAGWWCGETRPSAVRGARGSALATTQRNFSRSSEGSVVLGALDESGELSLKRGQRQG